MNQKNIWVGMGVEADTVEVGVMAAEVCTEGGVTVVVGDMVVEEVDGEVEDGVTITMEIWVIMGVLIIRGMDTRPTTLMAFIPLLIQ